MIAFEVASHDLLVRELEPPDEAEVQALFTACDDWFEAATGQPSMPGDVQSMYYAVPVGADLAAKRILVVVRRGAIVGVVDAVLHHPTPDGCAVGAFLLHPDHRRQGVGTALAGALLERVRGHRVSTVSAGCAPGFEPGLGFLRALGFTVEPLAEWTEAVDRNRGPHEPVPLRATLDLGPPSG